MCGMLETQPMTPTIVRALRGFADGAFGMVSMRAAASTIGIFDSSSDPMLVMFDLPGGGVLQLAAADERASAWRGDRSGMRVGPRRQRPRRRAGTNCLRCALRPGDGDSRATIGAADGAPSSADSARAISSSPQGPSLAGLRWSRKPGQDKALDLSQGGSTPRHAYCRSRSPGAAPRADRRGQSLRPRRSLPRRCIRYGRAVRHYQADRVRRRRALNPFLTGCVWPGTTTDSSDAGGDGAAGVSHLPGSAGRLRS